MFAIIVEFVHRTVDILLHPWWEWWGSGVLGCNSPVLSCLNWNSHSYWMEELQCFSDDEWQASGLRWGVLWQWWRGCSGVLHQQEGQEDEAGWPRRSPPHPTEGWVLALPFRKQGLFEIIFFEYQIGYLMPQKID